MIQANTEALVVCVVIAGVSYLADMAIAYGAEAKIRADLKQDRVDERIQQRSTLALRLQARRESMLPRLVKLEAEVKSARRRQYMVTKRLADLSAGRSALIRVVGEEEAFARPERPGRRFEAHLIIRHVQRALLEQKEHPFLAPWWARSQRVEVWALSIAEAKAVVEKAFPPATGFYLIEIMEPEDDTNSASSGLPTRLAAQLDQ
ncbi:hypothetical protein [Indioceanicola profundi]|uniref:hypothetical protein n=1 Tax=Indioceanicola profundi TaxID=2220096 RepID=UPI000E6AC18D|nr:hypothetical protein [Indioceanicola profundi]